MTTEFERLREVAKVIAKYHVGKVGMIDFDDPADLYSRLVSALLNPEITHPLQIPDFAEGKSDGFVSSVQSQAKDRLYDMMFNLRIMDGSDLRKGVYQNSKDLFLVEVFTVLGLRASAAKLAASGLKKARLLGLTANAVQFLRLLRSDASVRGDRKAHADFAEKLRRTVDQFQAEIECETIAEDVISMMTATVADATETRLTTSKALKRLDYFYRQHPSFTTGLNYFRIAAINAELKRDFESCLALCEEVRQFFASHKSAVGPSHSGEFLLRSCEAALHLDDLSLLAALISDARPIYPHSSVNWFVVQHYEFLLLMKQGHYAEAFDLAQSVVASPKYPFLNADRQKRWTLYEIYAAVFCGEARRQDGRRLLETLRDVCSALPAYKADKDGFNALFILLENILLLELGAIDELGDGQDKLRVYKNRHLGPGTVTRAVADLICYVVKHLDDPAGCSLPEPPNRQLKSYEVLMVSYVAFRQHISEIIAQPMRSRSRACNDYDQLAS